MPTTVTTNRHDEMVVAAAVLTEGVTCAAGLDPHGDPHFRPDARWDTNPLWSCSNPRGVGLAHAVFWGGQT